MAERNGDGKGGNGGHGVQINLELYGKRLKALNQKWKEHKKEMWGGADALAVVTPPASEDLRYLKSTALHIWLLGYEFPETVMVFMPGALHFVCSSKKAGHLEDLQKSSKMLTGVDIHIHVKERKQDGSTQMNAVLEAVQGHSRNKPPVMGVLAREAAEGPLMEKWAECLDGSGATTVDVSSGFSEIFAVKDEVKNSKSMFFHSCVQCVFCSANIRVYSRFACLTNPYLRSSMQYRAEPLFQGLAVMII
jgi:nucleosome binding factor SPN SPT16 subunit